MTGFEPAASCSQTGTENFFRPFLTLFYHFRSYSVTLVTSYKPPFPPVPRASVAIHVVKNASRSKEREAFSMFKVSALQLWAEGYASGFCEDGSSKIAVL